MLQNAWRCELRRAAVYNRFSRECLGKRYSPRQTRLVLCIWLSLQQFQAWFLLRRSPEIRCATAMVLREKADVFLPCFAFGRAERRQQAATSPRIGREMEQNRFAFQIKLRRPQRFLKEVKTPMRIGCRRRRIDGTEILFEHGKILAMLDSDPIIRRNLFRIVSGLESNCSSREVLMQDQPSERFSCEWRMRSTHRDSGKASNAETF